jgi:hypothetical protein
MKKFNFDVSQAINDFIKDENNPGTPILVCGRICVCMYVCEL